MKREREKEEKKKEKKERKEEREKKKEMKKRKNGKKCRFHRPIFMFCNLTTPHLTFFSLQLISGN